MVHCSTSFCHIHRHKAASRDRQELAVTRYSLGPKRQSRYRTFKFVWFRQDQSRHPTQSSHWPMQVLPMIGSVLFLIGGLYVVTGRP